MTKIEWKSSYSVGIQKLDDQHKVLIRIINDLDDAQRSGGEIVKIFDELHHYVKEHFSYEEQLMEQAGYQDIEEHKKGHRGFEQWLASVELTFNSGGGSAFYVAETVSEFLRNWLVQHILVDDMAYAPVIGDSKKTA